MGQPVVHFEIAGKDAEKLWSFYGEMFGWEVDASNPMNYGVVARDDNVSADGWGIGGGICAMPDEMPGYITVYAEVPDVEVALTKAERLGGKRLMGPEQIPDGPEIGMFQDPEGRPFGVIKEGTR